ncbi:hypothetical protein Dimus_025465 [Dionaea muscipula]
MSSRCKYYEHSTLHNKRSFFLPIMLCSRPSIKDVRHSHRRSASLTDDPASPRVGCAGQVTRTNKVLCFPAAATTTQKFNLAGATPSRKSEGGGGDSVKYQKLKRFFSGKSLTVTDRATTIITAATTKSDREDRSGECRGGRGVVLEEGSNRKENRRDLDLIFNVADLDPPLPVIKKDRQSRDCGGICGERGSLWKRRSGGVVLQSLQVKSIQCPFLHANTVELQQL